MPFTEIRLYGYVLECDVAATQAAYEQITLGDSETCRCIYCRNFIASRLLVYPPAALSIYEQLGIAPHREAETYEAGRVDGGLHLYAGWHHFIRRIKEDPCSGFELTKDFSICFLEGRSCAERVFDPYPLVQVEFSVVVPWLLPEVAPA